MKNICSSFSALLCTTGTLRLGAAVTAVLATTTSLSDVATEVAKVLGIRVDTIPLPQKYPTIKCNINLRTGERIYHLPFDQQYDRTQICRPGECYDQFLISGIITIQRSGKEDTSNFGA